MQLNHSAKLDEIASTIQNITFQSSRTKESPLQTGAFTNKDFRLLPDRLLDLADDVRKVSTQQTILRGLYFRSMLVRRQSIAEAHAETFGWVFRHPDQRDSTALDHVSNFTQWLESENGIYWVAGKAGSGKSTLMKFLGDHPCTTDLLSAWSHPHECIIACHYFWSSGTRLQKSIDGLLRSLLYEIFRQVPDLIFQAIPEDVGADDDEASFALGGEGRPWSTFELGQIVDRLVACDDMSVRFCFFIDGLDEYGGDHREVIKILSRLASSPNIKLCVSSRPWNVFSDVYGATNDWKLSLQDLTRNDIRRYTESILKEHPNWAEYSDAGGALVQEITDKAQGVFLWVFLVVRSFHEGITNGDGVSTLRRRISQLPQDLEAFFKHILDGVDPFYHLQMAQTFKTALQAEEPLSLMVYSLIDQCTNDDSFALRSPVAPMDRYEVFARRKQMSRRLNGRCKGLLEIQADSTAIDYIGPRVNFLHRTVRDFLLTKEMADFLDGAAPDFKASAVIFRAHVALVKAMPVKKEHFQRSGIMSRILTEAFVYAHEAEAELGSYEAELVDELRDTVEDMTATFDADTPWDPNYFLDFAIAKGLSQYLAQHRECLPGARSVVNGSFLREALMVSTKPSSDDSPDMTSVVSLFLQRGADSSLKEGVIWADWLTASSAAMAEWGLNYTWAVRQRRILELLLGHGADVNDVLAKNARWGDFVEALFRLSEHAPDRRLSAVYLDMLKTLLRRGADPNVPYRGTTVGKTLFANISRAAGLHLVDAQLSNGPSVTGLPKLPAARLKLLAQMAEVILRHGAHPSCLPRPSDLNIIFPPRLAEPLRELWDARRAETRTGVMSVIIDWLWPS